MSIVILNESVTACSRAVYEGPNGTVITGRTMDWMEDVKSNLWIFQQGVKRNGNAGQNSINWISKYGSVVASGYEAGTADGMNEMGLVANILYLAESGYGARDLSKPGLTTTAWAQYVLDNFATVSEAVDVLRTEPYQLVAPVLPNGSPATFHLAISDATGDNAIFEFIEGKLIIHHDRKYQVATNSPTFDKQLALTQYWKGIGGSVMLPGTYSAADRFVRASFYIEAITQTEDINTAVAGVFSVMRNVSVPIGISIPEKPNLASTIWRTVADQKNRVYYFESTMKPNVFWVSFKDIDFSNGASIKKLTLTNGDTFSGNTSGLFVNSEPFKFLGK
jgi:choloylglycine hydrolase